MAYPFTLGTIRRDSITGEIEDGSSEFVFISNTVQGSLASVSGTIYNDHTSTITFFIQVKQLNEDPVKYITKFKVELEPYNTFILIPSDSCTCKEDEEIVLDFESWHPDYTNKIHYNCDITFEL